MRKLFLIIGLLCCTVFSFGQNKIEQFEQIFDSIPEFKELSARTHNSHSYLLNDFYKENKTLELSRYTYLIYTKSEKSKIEVIDSGSWKFLSNGIVRLTSSLTFNDIFLQVGILKKYIFLYSNESKIEIYQDLLNAKNSGNIKKWLKKLFIEKPKRNYFISQL